MEIRQISVFVENRSGRLAEITEILEQSGVDIRALSIADTADYGILRMIVNDPDAAVNALKEAGLTVSATEVLGIGIPDEPGGFAKAIRVLADVNMSVEYAYAFISPKAGVAYVILRVENNSEAEKVLREKGIEVISQQDIFTLNND